MSEKLDSGETQPNLLTITDLQNLLKIVDYAAEQGAFRGWNTIYAVSEVREKLARFLLMAEKPAKQEPELSLNEDEPTTIKTKSQKAKARKGE